MMMRKRSKQLLPRIRCGGIHKLITYHPCLARTFDGWAADCGQKPQTLRKMTECAIRTRHQEARIDHISERANGRQPDVYCLDLNRIQVYYTIELHAVVVRGYAWELNYEPRDDFEGGGFICDAAWHLPPKIEPIGDDSHLGNLGPEF